jgi:hypothetical protein
MLKGQYKKKYNTEGSEALSGEPQVDITSAAKADFKNASSRPG